MTPTPRKLSRQMAYSPIPEGADTAKVTAKFLYEEIEELRRYVRANRNEHPGLGQMEFVRYAVLRAMREGWLPPPAA